MLSFISGSEFGGLSIILRKDITKNAKNKMNPHITITAKTTESMLRGKFMS